MMGTPSNMKSFILSTSLVVVVILAPGQQMSHTPFIRCPATSGEPSSIICVFDDAGVVLGGNTVKCGGSLELRT